MDNTSSRTSTTTTVVGSDYSNRNSKRMSVAAPSIAESAASGASASTLSTHSDSRIREIKDLGRGLDRLNKNSQLSNQRYVVSSQKQDDLETLALGAKVERALGRRMTGQDAVMRPKSSLAKSTLVQSKVG